MCAAAQPEISGRAGLVRSRLLDELAGLRTARLALVVAPAGAGKTTLLAHYAAVWDGPVGWTRIGAATTTAERLVQAIWQAIPGLPTADPPADVDGLLWALNRFTGQNTLLIVDDLHLLGGPAATTALETVAAHAPGWLHLLVAGRCLPDFNLSRYEFADTCLIDEERLRFRSWEVENLLRAVYREPLPPDDAAALTRRLSGWAAGLHMFHLSTRGQPLAERRRAVAALDGRSAIIRGYLARTVLDDLPVDLREFLIRTCVFQTVTAARCEALLGGPGTSRAHLEELERRQAFTSSPDGGRSYRYHEALRAHLAVTLSEEVGEVAARRWHGRAAALLAAEGAEIEAARAFARAEDWPAVRRLLARLGTRVADGVVEPWRDVLPDWLVAEDPWLILAEARHLFARGRVAAAVRCLRNAEEHFADDGARSRCRATRRLAAVWLPGRDAMSGHHNAALSGHYGGAVPGHYGVALRDATRRHPTLVAAAATGQPLVQLVGYLLAGNVAEASRALPMDSGDDTEVASLGVRLVRGCWELATGSPEGGHRLSQVLADAEHAGLVWLVRMARAARALDGTAAGGAQARAVVRECDRDDDPWGAVLALAGVCLIRSVAAHPEPADLDDAVELLRRCRHLDAGVLQVWAQALVAIATAAAGLPEAELEAQHTEALARSAGVPGARVAVLAAGARCGTGRPDLRGLAAHCGLPPSVARRWSGPSELVAVQVTEPAPVDITCFGGFRMHLAGRPVDLSAVRPRTRTALRLLAMQAGRPVHRETLIEALWPDLPPAAATRNLHVTLSSLRTFLEPGSPRGHSGLVARSGDAYRLALPEGGSSDVADFHAAVATARHARLAGDTVAVHDALRRAVLAYAGDLLPEDGPAEWVVHERETLRHQAADAAVGLATVVLAAGRVQEAVAAAERCVQIDRYCDAAWRLLADGYDRLRNPAAAARARRDYLEVLASLHTPDPEPTVVAPRRPTAERTAPPPPPRTPHLVASRKST
ncbi:MAG TPA: BTAD domain-containing putative transcriptional regulator, partial [Catenuloplanes sp.]|jgi:DNA-binding SARP family transcriptional activator